MIIFKEIIQKNTFYFMVFENENGAVVEIPIDEKIARQFPLYFERLSPSMKGVERTPPSE